jgi:hypothetical protein
MNKLELKKLIKEILDSPSTGNFVYMCVDIEDYGLINPDTIKIFKNEQDAEDYSITPKYGAMTILKLPLN